MINPVQHGATPADAALYKVEPYVVAADVYAVSPHIGRGGWSWYTGSSGWMYRLMVESLLGVSLAGERLTWPRDCRPTGPASSSSTGSAKPSMRSPSPPASPAGMTVEAPLRRKATPSSCRTTSAPTAFNCACRASLSHHCRGSALTPGPCRPIAYKKIASCFPFNFRQSAVNQGGESFCAVILSSCKVATIKSGTQLEEAMRQFNARARWPQLAIFLALAGADPACTRRTTANSKPPCMCPTGATPTPPPERGAHLYPGVRLSPSRTRPGYLLAPRTGGPIGRAAAFVDRGGAPAQGAA